MRKTTIEFYVDRGETEGIELEITGQYSPGMDECGIISVNTIDPQTREKSGDQFKLTYPERLQALQLIYEKAKVCPDQEGK